MLEWAGFNFDKADSKVACWHWAPSSEPGHVFRENGVNDYSRTEYGYFCSHTSSYFVNKRYSPCISITQAISSAVPFYFYWGLVTSIVSEAQASEPSIDLLTTRS